MSNPIEILRDCMNPTPEEAMGPYHAANFRNLMAQQQSRWDQTQTETTADLYQNLVPKIEELLERKMTIFFQQGHFVCLDDCGGYSPHFYAIRFAEPFKPEGLFKKPIRTVVLLGDESSNSREGHVEFIYVNSKITPKEKPQEILDLTLEHFNSKFGKLLEYRRFGMRVAKLGLPNPLATYFDTFGHLGPREFLK